MARTLLQLVQEACSDVGQPRPSVVVSSTVETPIRMLRLINKAGRSLIQEVEFNELLTARTFTAVAAQEQVEPPSDYHRMTPHTEIWDVGMKRPVVGPISGSNWINLTTNTLTGADKYWMFIAGKINIYPAPAVTDDFSYMYQTKNWVVSSTATAKDSFTADDDEPRFDDELLLLELIWRWRAALGIDYAEAMQDAARRKEMVMAANRARVTQQLSDPFQGELPDGYWPGRITG